MAKATPKRRKLTTQNLARYIQRLVCEDVAPGRSRVDRENGIVFRVKVLGLESENGRRYLPEAVHRGKPLYEGIQVNANHPDRPDKPRDVNDRFGWLENIQVEDDGSYGDLHILIPESDLGQAVMAAAEQKPDLFGLSHNAEGAGYTDENGIFVIEEITEVRSVDLVDRPATNRSLFEERKQSMKKITLHRFLEAKTLKLKIPAWKRTAIKRLMEGNALDMKIAESEGGTSDYTDHLYAAHKACREAGDGETGNKILGILKDRGGTDDDKNLSPAEDKTAGLKEEDNLDMEIGKNEINEDEDEAEKFVTKEGEDEDKDGKPSTNDKEPDDLKKKANEGRRPRKSTDPAIKQLQEQVARLKAKDEANTLDTFIRQLCESKKVPCDKPLLKSLRLMRDREAITEHVDYLHKAGVRPRGPRSQGPITESFALPEDSKSFAAALLR